MIKTDGTEHITLGVIAGNCPKGLGQVFLQYHNRKLRKSDSSLLDDHLIHDGTVYLKETKLDAAADHLIMPVSHTGMLINAAVAEQIAHFLQHGQFKR